MLTTRFRSEPPASAPTTGSDGAAREISFTQAPEGHYIASFQALGGPCEVLIDADEPSMVHEGVAAVVSEARRIEAKFSRYHPTGVVHRINSADGAEVVLDEESCGLIDYAQTCYQLSDGAFDITSGVLRRVWRFDGSGRVPTANAVDEVCALVGWQRVKWDRPRLQLQPGMEIDLGGIGKEYAVDRAALLLEHHNLRSALVNFGGDLRATGARQKGRPWLIGIDNPHATGRDCVKAWKITGGALATSGDARRFIIKQGRRYGHILDPRTGWPIIDAPRSVTVRMTTCLEAGMLATFGMLKGADAETFLQSHQIPHMVVRE